MIINKENKFLQNEDDCNCGKSLKINDPRRKIIKKIKKKI